jgi:hypothetical protein
LFVSFPVRSLPRIISGLGLAHGAPRGITSRITRSASTGSGGPAAFGAGHMERIRSTPLPEKSG